MPHARLAVVILFAAAFAAALAWWRRDAAVVQETAPPMRAAIVEPLEEATPQPANSPAVRSPQAESLPPDESLEQRFHQADDLLAFVESIQPAAKAGDGPSAWWIYRALRRCDIEYRYYFQRAGRIRTLDEALQINADNPTLPMDETRKLHAQCARLRESAFAGEKPRVAWLYTAASAGSPVARVELARAMLIDAQRNGGIATAREAARGLAAQGLKSREPAAMAIMGELAASLGGFGESRAELDWLLAACQRGLDCSPQSQIAVQWCRVDRDCQPFEDIEAMMRRHASADYDAIEGRAREINQLIDQGRYEELVYSVLPGK